MRISDWSSDVCSSDLVQIAPPARTLPELARARCVTGGACEFGEAEIGGGQFERVGGGAPAGRADRHVMELEPLIEAGALADAQHRAAGAAEILGGRHGDRKSTRLNSSH